MKNALLIVAILSLIFVAGCTGTQSNNQNNNQQQAYNMQPDRVLENLSVYKGGCPVIISEQELNQATTWASTDTSFFTGNYGAIQMDCDYYETTSVGKYHVAFAFYPGGTEKFQTQIDSWINQNKDKPYSRDYLVGLYTFTSKPGLLAFVDKQTGVIVWMRLSATGTTLTDADWNNFVSIARAVEGKLN